MTGAASDLHRAVAAPPGWYADWTSPGRERWWDGDEWTRHTAAVPGSAWWNTPLFGAAYARTMRIGANVVLRLAIVVALIGVVIALSWVVVVPLVRLLGPLVGTFPAIPLLWASVAVVFCCGAAALTAALVGYSRHRRLGALVPSLWFAADAAILLAASIIVAVTLL